MDKFIFRKNHSLVDIAEIMNREKQGDYFEEGRKAIDKMMIAGIGLSPDQKLLPNLIKWVEQ